MEYQFGAADLLSPAQDETGLAIVRAACLLVVCWAERTWRSFPAMTTRIQIRRRDVKAGQTLTRAMADKP
jgi:hypothetical protein